MAGMEDKQPVSTMSSRRPS